MLVCSKCGKPIRYIACGLDKTYCCDNEVSVIITANGHVKEGYKPHECKQ